VVTPDLGHPSVIDLEFGATLQRDAALPGNEVTLTMQFGLC
jgi:hypothetical protein